MIRNTSGSAERRGVIRRVVIYGIAAFLLGVSQCSFFSRLGLFGATPDLILGSLGAIVLLDNKRAALVYAVAAGYFIDALGALPPSFSPLFYLACATFVSIIAEKLIPRFISYVIILVPLVVFRAVFTYLNLWISLGALPPIGASLGIVLPEMLSTFILCLPVYYLIKLCTIPIGARSKFSF